MRNWKTTTAGLIPGVILFLYGFVQGLSDGKPFDFKSMLIGVGLAVLGGLAKDFNVSGGTKAILLLFALTACSMPVQAQQGFTLGAAYANKGTPEIMGWGAYDHALTGNLYSYSGYNVLPIWQTGSKIPQLQFTAFTGLAYRFATLNKLSLFVQGAGGLASTGDVTTGAANYGGFGHLELGKGWGLIMGGEGNYSPISGTNGTLRVGFRYGVK